MNRLSSFIFSSKAGDALEASPLGTMAVLRRILVSGLWVVVWLAVIDLGLWAITRNVLNSVPASLHRYLSYGHSQQSKLQEITGTQPGQATSVGEAGWLDTAPHSRPAPHGAVPGLCFSIYGMSFSEHLGEVLQERSERPGQPAVALRMASGPAAPPNWTYAAALKDRGHGACEHVVVWTILSSSLRGMDALSSQTWHFDQPFPFTYPKFDLDAAGAITRVDPAIKTLGEMQRALRSPELMKTWTEQMEREDAYYHPLLYGLRKLDASTLFGFARRGIARSWLDTQTKDHVANDEALQRSGVAARIEAMAQNFTSVIRAEGKIPVILLIEARNEVTHLGRFLCERDSTLPVFSTSSVIHPYNTSAYLPDGHFHTAPRRQIAAAFESYVDRQRGGTVSCQGRSVEHPMTH